MFPNEFSSRIKFVLIGLLARVSRVRFWFDEPGLVVRFCGSELSLSSLLSHVCQVQSKRLNADAYTLPRAYTCTPLHTPGSGMNVYGRASPLFLQGL